MYTLLAIQVVLGMEGTEALRQELWRLVRSAPAEQTYAAKARLYHKLGQALADAEDRYVSGVWDYVEDPGRADEEYRSWREGTVADAAEEAQEAQAQKAQGPGDAGGRSYMFVTVLFLMKKGGASDQFVCELCRMPEGVYWRKGTFERLFRSLRQLNFASVREDAIYVRPGEGGVGVREETLSEEHYGHLRRLE